MIISTPRSFRLALSACVLVLTGVAQNVEAAQTGTSITTYHVDTLRSGWNQSESTLTPATVSPSTFGIIATVPLDAQVDAAPLVLRNEQIAGASGPLNVAYVETANDTMYAIDSATGTILLERNLGTPVPIASVPGGCDNNSSVIGISSTPVIDTKTATMYLIAYAMVNGTPTYTIHALDVATLADKTNPVVVSASHSLNNGTTYAFNASVQRQRAALLEANGNIYAGFASFCDNAHDLSRGWVLGWQAATLAPLPSNVLTDDVATDKQSFFLSSVWMSGDGIASDDTGSLYFSTGNSDSGTYDGINSIQESVVREAPDLSSIQSIFTPSNQATLDKSDLDLGAAGLALLPYISKAGIHRLAFAGSKDGRLFVLNRDNLGGYSSSSNNNLQTLSIGRCWCAPSTFMGSDGSWRVVSSGGGKALIWKLSTNPVALALEHTTSGLSTAQDPGFMTSVSSMGTAPGTAVLWAVSRPVNKSPADIRLYAFDASTGASLYSSIAGTWPTYSNNATIVPVVANGRVLVASYGQLAIYGLTSTPAARSAVLVRGPRPPALAPNKHELFGRVVAVSGTHVILQLRSGRTLDLDATAALRTHRVADVEVGGAIEVHATQMPGRVLLVDAIHRAKDSPDLWGDDR